MENPTGESPASHEGTYLNMTQRTFGRLTVLRRDGSNRRHCALWLCVCRCGAEVVVNGHNLRSGHSRSCGCLQRERAAQANAKHGHASKKNGVTVEYNCWAGMIYRCENPNVKDWKYYGGRGIKVCPEWRESFEVFLRDMGTRPSPSHSIDRIEPDGNYEPGNCRWATPLQQRHNRGIR